MINSSVTEIPTTLQPSTELTNGSSSYWLYGLIIPGSVAAITIVLIVLVLLCVHRCTREPREFPAEDVASGDDATVRGQAPVIPSIPAPEINRFRLLDQYVASSRTRMPRRRRSIEAVPPSPIGPPPWLSIEGSLTPGSSEISRSSSLSAETLDYPLTPSLASSRTLLPPTLLSLEASSTTRFPPTLPLIEANQITKTITVDGGAIETDDITLRAGQGWLAENTDIVMERVDRQFNVLKSLLDLGLVDGPPRVVKFSPGGLKFSKPVDLKINFGKTATNSERFILHGVYDLTYQRIIWELVTNGVKENDAEGVIHVKISSFSFYMFITSTYKFLARILSHINQSFICLAYSFYRRSLSKDTIDIAVVLVSEFFDENKENNIKHLLAEGFVKGEKGVLKRVDTDHPLEMCLDFPGMERPPYSFQVDQYLLDSVGFVIDYFKEIAVIGPANGEVKISEKKGGDENESLWILSVYEINEEIQAEVAAELTTSPDMVAEVESASSDPTPTVVNRTTKLTNTELTSISQEIGADWDDVAALLGISYSDREQIRMNNVEFLSFSSKAKQVLKLFNNKQCFDRYTLVKCMEELKRQDLKNMMPSVNDEGEPHQQDEHDLPSLRVQDDTRFSSRELYRLSQHLVVDWETLASLLGISTVERDNIRHCVSYFKSHSRAEKTLAIFNYMKDFSRHKLAECLEEIGQLELKKPVITGKWRKL